jgi:glucose-1-phosphate cytidylyltransferase
VEFDADSRVTGFREKPRLVQHWINAGFFVMEREIFQHWNGTNLEREVLPGLVSMGKLSTFRHDGFFKSMDTYKDQQELEEIMLRGDALPGVRQAPPQEGTKFVSVNDLARLAVAS